MPNRLLATPEVVNDVAVGQTGGTTPRAVAGEGRRLRAVLGVVPRPSSIVDAPQTTPPTSAPPPARRAPWPPARAPPSGRSLCACAAARSESPPSLRTPGAHRAAAW